MLEFVFIFGIKNAKDHLLPSMQRECQIIPVWFSDEAPRFLGLMWV